MLRLHTRTQASENSRHGAVVSLGRTAQVDTLADPGICTRHEDLGVDDQVLLRSLGTSRKLRSWYASSRAAPRTAISMRVSGGETQSATWKRAAPDIAARSNCTCHTS